MSKSGSDAESVSPQVIDDAAFTRLVARGLDRVDNVVTGDEAIEALGEVDPTPDAIEKLRERLAESGVTLDDAVPVAEEIEALLLADVTGDATGESDVDEIVIIAHDPLLDDLEDEHLLRQLVHVHAVDEVVLSLALQLADAELDGDLIALHGPLAEDRDAAHVAPTEGDAAGALPASESG